jgi:hypothetical protein
LQVPGFPVPGFRVQVLLNLEREPRTGISNLNPNLEPRNLEPRNPQPYSGFPNLS